MNELTSQLHSLTLSPNKVKPLIILDLNGILISRKFVDEKISDTSSAKTDNSEIVGKFRIWKRPGCDSFLDFLFSKFEVAVFSSITRPNIEMTVKYIFGEKVSQLKFIYNQNNCVKISKLADNEKENKRDITFCKNLQIVWNAFPEYNENNTLIIDDSPEKMVYNPSQAYFIAETWSPAKENDTSLSPGGIIYQRILTFHDRVAETSLESN